MAVEEIFQSHHTSLVLDTLKYVKKFCGQRFLIKIGGAPLENPELVEKFCSDLSLLRAAGISVVLVHGGGQAINKALEAAGLSWEFVNGQRATTKEMIDVIEPVLCGKLNKKIVRTLNANGVKAVGLSGVDAGLLHCKPLSPELGLVGKVESVNTDVLKAFIDQQSESNQGIVPVVSSMGVDSQGHALNVNADSVAVALGAALKVSKLIFLTDQDGIFDDEGDLISQIDQWGVTRLLETGAVQGGMMTKAKSILSAMESGIDQVHVINGSRAHSIIEEVFTDKGVGTVCQAEWVNEEA